MSSKGFVVVLPHFTSPEGLEIAPSPEIVAQPVVTLVTAAAVVRLIETATRCAGNFLKVVHAGWVAYAGVLAAAVSFKERATDRNVDFTVLATCTDPAVIVYLLLFNTSTGFWDFSEYSFYIGSPAHYRGKNLFPECSIAVDWGDFRQTE